MCKVLASNLDRVSGNSATHCCAERHNLSAMTHPSKTDLYYPYGITLPAQQQTDSVQEGFSPFVYMYVYMAIGVRLVSMLNVDSCSLTTIMN